MRKRNILVIMISLVCVLIVGIGFAAVNIPLKIGGTIIAPASVFDVRFIEGEGYTVSKTNVEGDTAIITDLSLSARGEEKLVWLSIQNKSSGYTAEIPMSSFVTEVTSSTGGNVEDIEIQIDCRNIKNDKVTLAPNETTDIVVLAMLLKEQIEDNKFELSITFTANSVWE